MSIEQALKDRARSKCELCKAVDDLTVYAVPPVSGADVDTSILVCVSCNNQIDGSSPTDSHHWRCLSDSMWTPVPAVQAVSWRMLNRLSSESWAQDALELLYLDDETLGWAQATGEGLDTESTLTHKDSNGAILSVGDTVTLTKDLNVKGTSFTAKRGTAVRGISLVADNAAHIEGRVNGQQIVILTEFVKKSG